MELSLEYFSFPKQNCTTQKYLLLQILKNIRWISIKVLAGVVTELGGLISHGAVVAREYGLPCLVGVAGATSALRTGDIVTLDAVAGSLTRRHTEQADSDNMQSTVQASKDWY